MKHMVVNTHNAESCGFRSEADGNAIGAAIEGLGKSGLTIDHFWINRSAHAFFIVVDAPNAHEIDAALLGSGLIGRTHTEIFPILTMEEVRDDAQRRSM
jgi:predicted aconitase